VAYRLLMTDEVVADGVRRIGGEQIDKAIAEVLDPDLDRHVAVHQVRKRCKKLRGLLRLVRDAIGAETYQAENAWFRDAARALSATRDAQAVLETFDALMKDCATEVGPRGFAALRRRLLQHRSARHRQRDLDAQLETFCATMHVARLRVDDWSLICDGFTALEDGLERTYDRARRAMRRVAADPSTENLHEWRKRVKYHRYHLRLLRESWPAVLRAHHRQVVTLSELLGDDHNLAVLRDQLGTGPRPFRTRRDVQALSALIDRRRTQLQAEAASLGARVFAERPPAHGRRLRRYWRAWRHDAAAVSPPARARA
jgi:CHAD domain-containing protein